MGIEDAANLDGGLNDSTFKKALAWFWHRVSFGMSAQLFVLLCHKLRLLQKTKGVLNEKAQLVKIS